jgi:Virulence-associated protein E
MGQSTTKGINGQLKRFKGDFACPVCKGTEDEHRGQGTRCFGYLSGNSIFCTREDHANQAPFVPSASGYRHNAKGPCPCGQEHSPVDPPPGHKSKRAYRPIDRVYPYRDAAGKVVHETVRFKPKGFSQRRPGPNGKDIWSLKGVKRVLYHLPELLTADPMRPVWIVEGEKDADRLRLLGEVATTCAEGAGKWKDEYADTLTGRICRIIADNDEPGRRHAEKVAQSLQGKAKSVTIVELPGLPDGGDVSDFLNGGGTLEQLNALANGPPKERPILNARGRWVSCLHNSLLWIADKGYTVRYDSFRHLILVDGRPLDDETVIAFTTQIEAGRRIGWKQEHTRSALIALAHRNQFNSLTEWLDSLKWDGTPRLNAFFHDAYACESTPYTEECARVLFLSGVARAYDPGVQADVMVVLIGPQGIGKSMGMSALCPDPLWYADDLGCDLFERKAGEGLRGKWLIEFSEFSRINRATIDVVKSFVSRRSDYYRPAYGRIHKDFPRTCVFVGTTNDDHPLTDRENRRFMPIHCGNVVPGWIAANREQLWAEAVHRYRGGDKWWVTDPTLLAEVAEKQEDARQDDLWEAILSREIGHINTVTMERAAEALNLYNDRMDRGTQMRIGLALKSLGYTRRRVRNGTARNYEWTKDPSLPVPPF